MNLLKLNSYLPRRSLLLIAAGLFLLSFVSAYYFKVQPSINYQQRLLQRYLEKQEKDAGKFLQDSNMLRKLVLKSESLDEFKKIAGKVYGVFLFAETISDNQDLLFWNNQKILPPKVDFDLEDGEYFQKLDNGYYVVIKKTLRFSNMSNNIIAYVLVPIFNEYYIKTDYLLKQFVHDKDAVKKISLSEVATDYPIKSLKNKDLFYIKRVTHTNLVVTDTLTIVLRLAALIFLLVFVHLVAESIVRKKRALIGILFFVV